MSCASTNRLLSSWSACSAENPSVRSCLLPSNESIRMLCSCSHFQRLGAAVGWPSRIMCVSCIMHLSSGKSETTAYASSIPKWARCLHVAGVHDLFAWTPHLLVRHPAGHPRRLPCPKVRGCCPRTHPNKMAATLLLTLAMASSLQVSRIVSVTPQCLLPNLA